MAGIEAKYVGMSTDYGTCEMVPVAEASKQNSHREPTSLDEYFSPLPPLMFGTADGTLDPWGDENCIRGQLITFTSLVANALLVKEALQLVALKRTPKEKIKSARKFAESFVVPAELAALGHSIYFTRPSIYYDPFHFKIVSKLFTMNLPPSIWRAFLQNNYLTFTPFGLWKVGKETWNTCGRPGGGLWERIWEPPPQPVAELQPAPIPAAKRVEILQPKPEDVAKIGIWTTVLAVGAALLKSLDLVLSRATGLLLLSPKEEDNLI